MSNQVTRNQAAINIINAAVIAGFEFDIYDSVEEVKGQAINFLISDQETNDKIVVIEEEAEVRRTGTDQSVSYHDEYGTDYVCSGEIINTYAHAHEPADTKVYHSVLVDNIGRVVNLYYVVGETEYNQPEEEEEFDVEFNDEKDSNSKGFNSSLEYCKKWIDSRKSDRTTYFGDYIGGTVSIRNLATGEVVYEEPITEEQFK